MTYEAPGRLRLRHAWLFVLPLLFLPNFGLGPATAYGVVEMADLLLFPFLVLLGIAVRWQRRALVVALVPLMVAFVLWAFFSTFTVWVRYDYPGAIDEVLLGSSLKLAKLGLYGVAGVLTVQALATTKAREGFEWALLGAAVIVAGTLLVMQEDASVWGETVQQGYKSTNQISVTLSILLCYLGVRYVTGRGTAKWRAWAGPALLLALAGFTLTGGRGGWIGALAGLAVAAYRLGPRRQIVGTLLAITIVAGAAYSWSPFFRSEVEKTLWPDEAYLVQYGAGIGGIDDGARLTTWINEAGKFLDAPILGTGFWHRSGETSLWSTGSHNFWLQMFLETGIIGGVLALMLVWAIWRQTTTSEAIAHGVSVPVQAALAAAFVAGLSETYFYGGIALLAAMFVYAPLGSCIDRSPSENTEDRLRPLVLRNQNGVRGSEVANR